jgi:hypothetical protein
MKFLISTPCRTPLSLGPTDRRALVPRAVVPTIQVSVPDGNESSGPTGTIDLNHVRAPQVDRTLDPERAADRILPWFDDDDGAAQGLSKRERIGDVVEWISAAPVPAGSRASST